MSAPRGLGLFSSWRIVPQEPNVTYVLRQPALNRILNFTGRTIHDVVNDPIVKNEILGYYKLHKFIDRRSEMIDLERQWNAVG